MDTDCRKSLFFQKSACSQSLTPNPFPVAKGCVCLVGSASCRAFGHTRPASVPGLSVGLPPLVQARMLVVSHTKPLHDAVAQMADDLYGGYAPKQGRFGCLPKVLHDAKPTKQATLDTPFLSTIEVFRQTEIHCPKAVDFLYIRFFLNHQILNLHYQIASVDNAC